MFHTEFRTEPIEPPVPTPPGRTSQTDSRHATGRQAVIDSLMLEFRLHGMLSPVACDLLQQLSPAGSSLLLQYGRTCWGTARTDGLEQLVADHRPLCRSGSIFTARLEPENPAGPGRGRVHLTCVGSKADQPLLLGLVESAPSWVRGEGPERLSLIADQFRTGLDSAAEAHELLEPYLAEQAPCLVVNRASGRLLVANQPLLTRLNRAASELIGQEYSALSADLFQAAGRQSFRFQNLTCGEFQFGLVRILGDPKIEPVHEVSPALTDLVIPALQDNVGAIMLAASHQATLADSGRTAELRELSDLIVEETADLDRTLGRLRLLLPGSGDQLSSVRIAEEIAAAGEAVQHRLAVGVDDSGLDLSVLPAIEARPRAVEMIVEAVLLAHLMPDPTGRSTRVEVASDSEAIVVGIVTELDPIRPSGRHTTWQACALQLAGAVGLIQVNNSDRPLSLTSSIRITSPRVRGNHD